MVTNGWMEPDLPWPWIPCPIARPFGLRYIDLSKYEGGDSGDEAMASAGRWWRNSLFEAMGQRVWEMIRWCCCLLLSFFAKILYIYNINIYIYIYTSIWKNKTFPKPPTRNYVDMVLYVLYDTLLPADTWRRWDLEPVGGKKNSSAFHFSARFQSFWQLENHQNHLKSLYI